MATLLVLDVGGARETQNITKQQVVQRIGPGVKPPRLIFKVEPEYTPEARDANVQATVAFEIVVSEQGKATNITVLSPAGYGLDERAEAAIREWVFEPGQKGGKPVPILATVDVNFRFQNVPFDRRAEDRRKNFNIALARLSSEDGKMSATAANTMEQLVKEKFAPAIYQMGLLYSSGRIVPRDPGRGAALLADAAKRKYGPAMYIIVKDSVKNAENGPARIYNSKHRVGPCTEPRTCARRYFAEAQEPQPVDGSAHSVRSSCWLSNGIEKSFSIFSR